MHISEGILSAPVLLGGAALTAAGVWAGLRTMDDERTARTGVVAAALFVASLIHVPLGPGSVHLTLVGLAGVLLGWAVVPAVLIALLLQAVLFGHGGLTTLGVNTLNYALPALLCFYLFGGLLRRRSGPDPGLFACGFLAGGLGIALGCCLMCGELLLAGGEFRTLAVAVVVGHLPAIAIEGAITGALVVAVKQMRPEVFERLPAWPKLAEQSSG